MFKCHIYKQPDRLVKGLIFTHTGLAVFLLSQHRGDLCVVFAEFISMAQVCLWRQG